jgi:hypothetical protein
MKAATGREQEQTCIKGCVTKPRGDGAGRGVRPLAGMDETATGRHRRHLAVALRRAVTGQPWSSRTAVVADELHAQTREHPGNDQREYPFRGGS